MADKHSASESIASLDGGVAKIIKLHSPQKALRRISDLPTLLKLCVNVEAFEEDRAEEKEEIDLCENAEAFEAERAEEITEIDEANTTPTVIASCTHPNLQLYLSPTPFQLCENAEAFEAERAEEITEIDEANTTPTVIASCTHPNLQLYLSPTPFQLCENAEAFEAERAEEITDIDLCENAEAFEAERAEEIEEIDVSNMGMSLGHIPPLITRVANLTSLNLSGCAITFIPFNLKALTNLKDLKLGRNQINSVPSEIADMTQLTNLDLAFNTIGKVPNEISNLCSLTTCNLMGNQLTCLPDTFRDKMPNMRLIGLKSNQLTELPPSFTSLTSLVELFITNNQLKTFPEACLKASDREVAVKVFRADVSPDGRTEEEVCIACAVDHPNLTRVGALVLNGDEVGSRPSLMMDIVAGTPMALKPTSEHLLRCKWSPGTTFSTTAVVKIASGVASALEDVYAHNILVDEHYFATICDFGASFWYQKSETNFWEGMEVRAFGLFLKDLVDRIDESETKSETTPSPAHDLVDRCLNTSFNLRPAFKEIGTILASWTPVL
eukprot:gene6154-2765_t